MNNIVQTVLDRQVERLNNGLKKTCLRTIKIIIKSNFAHHLSCENQTHSNFDTDLKTLHIRKKVNLINAWKYVKYKRYLKSDQIII